ncbi:hypothetical protein [Dokdonella sp.]|uniref:hypothetical protein n=1 Tax=Dokdonella sp. TaxID=2291710 RepID=UPI0031CB84D8|nr:hypothetical protein [Dokdonella sp.]
MTASAWLWYLTFAFVLGAFGQLIRVAIGLKKLSEKNASRDEKTPFDPKKFWISMVLGALAAVITAVVQWNGAADDLDRDFVFTMMAAGYAGSDIIEGLIARWTKVPTMVPPDTPKLPQ